MTCEFDDVPTSFLCQCNACELKRLPKRREYNIGDGDPIARALRVRPYITSIDSPQNPYDEESFP